MLRALLLLFVCFSVALANCPAQTYANANFTASSPGVITGVCLDGFSGTPTRNCFSTGWSSAMITHCTRNVCPAMMEGAWNWTRTNGGQVATINCPSGWTGSVTKACSFGGSWEPTNNGCNNIPCTGLTQFNAVWATSAMPGLVTGTCVSGYSGTPTRMCNANGAWSPLLSFCTLNRCPVNVDEFSVSWNAVGAGTVAQHACWAGYTGILTRPCFANGTWGPTTNGCSTLPCPAVTQFNVDWPVQNTPGIATGTCVAGYTGTPTRPCRNGVWGAMITKCSRGVCVVDVSGTGNANWAQTASPNVAAGVCLAGYSGTPTRSCNADGSWGPVSNPCTLVANPCPAGVYGLATYPQGVPGSAAVGTCAPGFSGSPSRFCFNNGVWSASISNPCTRITCSATQRGNADLPLTNSGVTVQGTCISGTGRVLGTCGNNGSWSHTGVCA